MQVKRYFRSMMLAMLAPVAIAPAGCGAEDSNNDEEPSIESLTMTYHDGITLEGENGLSVAIMAADPAPPDKGFNTWTVAVKDAAGAPAAGATVIITPTMPQHGHGTNPADYAGKERAEEAGTYDFDPMNLIMPGAWAIDVAVTLTDGTTDTIRFVFDLAG